MKRKIELQLTEPLLATYHRQIGGCAIIASNPSIGNWYLNTCVDLFCNRKFLRGFTTPEIDIYKSNYRDNPHLEKEDVSLKYLKRHTCDVIKAMLDDGKYVYITRIDDFYIRGKTWYNTRHFPHDALIYGYDNEDETFLMYAYDENWLLRSFKTPINGVNRAHKATEKDTDSGKITALRVKNDAVELNISEIRDKIKNYLSSSFEKYPPDIDYRAFGIIVHEYIAMFLDKHIDGSIPYEKIDRRVFRQIWEHKKLMKLRIEACLKKLGVTSNLADRYGEIVKTADTMRMLYASHVRKRRDSVLPVIKEKLLYINEEEKKLLYEFLNELERIG